MYFYNEDDDREFAAQDAAHHAAEKERVKAEKEKAELVRMIFSDIDSLLLKNSERINFTDGTRKGYYKGTLEIDIADLEKKYKKKYRMGKNDDA